MIKHASAALAKCPNLCTARTYSSCVKEKLTFEFILSPMARFINEVKAVSQRNFTLFRLTHIID